VIQAIGGSPEAKAQWAAMPSAGKIALGWALLFAVAFGPLLWFGGSLNPCQALVSGHMPRNEISWAMSERLWQSEGPVGCYFQVLDAIVSPR
jgi:hypothetical protein